MSLLQALLFVLALYSYFGLLALKFLTAKGYAPWQALIPFYNVYLMTVVIERPWWWTILAILPVVGNVMMIVIFYELLHVYRLDSLKNGILGSLSLGLYFGYLGYSQKLEHQGRDLSHLRKHVSELGSSILFAIVAATLIRAFTFEAFTIPTPSMEKSLMVGDFLFVSKAHYGVRMPITPFALPLVHNRIPFTEAKAFTDLVQYPYLRLPAFQPVRRNEAVVFNYPMEDDFPIDKREHYVKRCLGEPGDTLQIVDRVVYLNGKANELPDRSERQFQYYLESSQQLSPRMMKSEFDINMLSPEAQQARGEEGAAILFNRSQSGYEYLITIAESQAEKVRALPSVLRLVPLTAVADPADLPADTPKNLRRLWEIYPPLQSSNEIFPNPKNQKEVVFPWTRDNYGPIYIPAAGDSVSLTPNNIHLYRRIITVYEGHELQQEGHRFLIDGKEVSHYRFEQDYYWMMGDNRHNSLDSRYWGFVPEDHIVGKPVFVWMSFDKYAKEWKDKIRFSRVFTVVHGEGKARSYFWYFAIVVGLIYGIRAWRKKRAA